MLNIHVEFQNAIAATGMEPPVFVVADGQIQRFSSSGRGGDKSGWYALHTSPFAVGVFGDWRTGVNETWHAVDQRTLSEPEKEKYSKRIELLRNEQKLQKSLGYEQAATRAIEILQQSLPADNHPYLSAKGVEPYGVSQYREKLVIPVRYRGEISSLQFVHANGDKRFLSGGRIQGCYFAIGKPAGVIYICEGFATGASIHEATGKAVAIAFNAGNLKPVAEYLYEQYPMAQFIVCADDDFQTDGNPGVSKAIEAAECVSGKVVVPKFPQPRPQNATDFNDLAQVAGLESVKEQLTQNSDSWSDPEPIDIALPSVVEFDVDNMLPAPLSGWVKDESHRMCCPPDYIAVTALTALGSLIGSNCAVRPKPNDSWEVVPNLWGGIVGPPSAKKSPSIAVALKPLDKLTSAATEDHQLAQSDYEVQKLVYEAQLEALEKSVKTSAKKGKSDELSSLMTEYQYTKQSGPVEPTAKRYKCNDVTVEKLGELLQLNPSGILMLRDELVGLLAGWEKEGRENERAFYLEAWNGTSSFDTDRIGRGSIHIPNLCVSVFGGIQPDKLTGYLYQAAHGLGNDGMLQRFQMLVYPDREKWQWVDEKPDIETRKQVTELFNSITELVPSQFGASDADDGGRPFFSYSEPALLMYIKWAEQLHTKKLVEEENPLIEQHLAKYEKLFSSLALIFHLVQCIQTGSKESIGIEAVKLASKWCDYLESHIRKCYALLSDISVNAAQHMASQIKQKKLKDGFTLRDIKRKQWRYLTKDEVVKPALEWLEEAGWIKPEITCGTGPGRKTVRYLINPKCIK